MKKHTYFLQIEEITKSVFETDIIDSKVKVIIPTGIPEKFMILNTETINFKPTTPETDIKKLENKHQDFDFFYLCVSEEMESYTEIALYPSGEPVAEVIAYVGIPKNNDWYIKSKQDYLDGLRVTLENYYNKINQWDVLVMDELCDEYPEDYYSYVVDDLLLCCDDGKFDQDSEEWFNNCKAKYDISQQEIDKVKNIIKSHKWTDESVYKIKNSMSLPIILDKKGLKHDLYAIKHLLITGRTGSGKTTLLKSILNSIECQSKTANCKVILIDTKDFDFKGYSSEYLQTPVIIDAQKAVEYLNKIQPRNENIAIVIDELNDLIAVNHDIQNVLINLMTNPKIHVIASAYRIDRLTNDFTNMFGGNIVFSDDKVGEYKYISKKLFDYE